MYVPVVYVSDGALADAEWREAVLFTLLEENINQGGISVVMAHYLDC